MSSENMLFDAEQAKNEALDMEYREQEYTAKVNRTWNLSDRNQNALNSCDLSRSLSDNPFG